MSKIRPLLMASGAFLKALLGRRDRIAGTSENGHTVLAGWEDAPEEKIIVTQVKETARQIPTPRAALYCHAGPHAGDVFFLGREQERVGSGALDQIVLTPDGVAPDANFQFRVNGVTQLVAGMGHSFKLNGATEHQADLFDFDELALLGNRFLVLDIGSQGTAEGEGQ